MRARQLFGDDVAVLEYRVPENELAKLDHLSFDCPTQAWMDFVRFQREFEPVELFHGGKTYDVVSGPMWERLPFGGFAADGRTVANWPFPEADPLSIHTETAIRVFNGALLR